MRMGLCGFAGVCMGFVPDGGWRLLVGVGDVDMGFVRGVLLLEEREEEGLCVVSVVR